MFHFHFILLTLPPISTSPEVPLTLKLLHSFRFELTFHPNQNLTEERMNTNVDNPGAAVAATRPSLSGANAIAPYTFSSIFTSMLFHIFVWVTTAEKEQTSHGSRASILNLKFF